MGLGTSHAQPFLTAAAMVGVVNSVVGGVVLALLIGIVSDWPLGVAAAAGGILAFASIAVHFGPFRCCCGRLRAEGSLFAGADLDDGQAHDCERRSAARAAIAAAQHSWLWYLRTVLVLRKTMPQSGLRTPPQTRARIPGRTRPCSETHPGCCARLTFGRDAGLGSELLQHGEGEALDAVTKPDEVMFNVRVRADELLRVCGRAKERQGVFSEFTRTRITP